MQSRQERSDSVPQWERGRSFTASRARCTRAMVLSKNAPGDLQLPRSSRTLISRLRRSRFLRWTCDLRCPLLGSIGGCCSAAYLPVGHRADASPVRESSNRKRDPVRNFGGLPDWMHLTDTVVMVLPNAKLRSVGRRPPRRFPSALWCRPKRIMERFCCRGLPGAELEQLHCAPLHLESAAIVPGCRRHLSVARHTLHRRQIDPMVEQAGDERPTDVMGR